MRFLILGRSVGLKKKKAKKRVIRIISSEKWFNHVLTFFWKMPKIWVGRMTLNGEKKRMALTLMDKLDTFILA